jgi:hypothetical protein
MNKTELEEYKKTFGNLKDMNKVVYFNLMRIGNDYNFIKNDFDNCVNWSSIIYDKESETFMNNYMFFSNEVMKYQEKEYSFYDLLLIMDYLLKQYYKQERMIYVNDYSFKNNQELMEKFGLNKYIGYEEIITNILNGELEETFKDTIKWNNINFNFNRNGEDKLLNKILIDRDYGKKSFKVMKLGKLKDFIDINYN